MKDLQYLVNNVFVEKDEEEVPNHSKSVRELAGLMGYSDTKLNELALDFFEVPVWTDCDKFRMQQLSTELKYRVARSRV